MATPAAATNDWTTVSKSSFQNFCTKAENHSGQSGVRRVHTHVTGGKSYAKECWIYEDVWIHVDVEDTAANGWGVRSQIRYKIEDEGISKFHHRVPVTDHNGAKGGWTVGKYYRARLGAFDFYLRTETWNVHTGHWLMSPWKR